jgi:adenylate kinase
VSPKRIVLLGPPGSGKGVQGRALSRRLGVPVISSGDLLRSASADAELSIELTARQSRGELLPDDLVLSLVREAVDTASSASGGYILDGYPRTCAQAEREEAPPVDAVVHIAVPDDEVRARLARRAQTEHRADDADTEAVERRIRRYHAETEPLLDHYAQHGILTTVDGRAAPNAVTDAILAALGTG